MNSGCLFCKIAAKQIPAKMIYEDADVFAFEDIGPQAPTHILICPGKMQLVAAELARKNNLLRGYRTVINSGVGAGQSVFHLHLHLLGGREFAWPPG
jgi:histidine triad (HIT) family protein